MRLLLVFLLLTTTTSCVKYALKKYGAIGGKPEIQKIITKDKDVLFLGMIHMAEKNFYTQSKKIIDSLCNDGYYIFGEGVMLGKDSLGKDRISMNTADSLNSKKIRKILGYRLSTSTEGSPVYKLKEKYNLEIQPKELYFTRSSAEMTIIDATTKDLVNYYENKKGEIKLDTCDIRTKVGQEYTCEKLPSSEKKFFRDTVIIISRNNLVIDAVKKSNKKKILIIYGKAHFEGIKKGLEN